MRGYTIDIDGSDTQIACAEDDTILRAALRARVSFPYECNSGGCGSCKFELVSGTVDTLWDAAPGLSPRDRARGRRLACQCVPTSPCTIKVRLNRAETVSLPPRRRVVALTEVQPLTPDMSEFCFEDGVPAEFLPGQFALLDLPGVRGSRGYSMSNLPNARGDWRFIVKRVPGGKGSSCLFDHLRVGDRVTMDAPYGFAYLRPRVARDIVCIGGGSGLSPMISIASAAVRESALRERKILMFYGGRRPVDICTPRLIERDPALAARVTCYNAISDPVTNQDDGWHGRRCFVHELVAQVLGDTTAQYEYYFCGPPPMTDAVAKMLVLDQHVPHEQIHFDRFY